MLLAFTLAVVGATLLVEVQWSIGMPADPEPGAGRVHEVVVNHGFRVFASERELAQRRILDSVLFPAALVALFAARALNRRYRPFASDPG